MDIKSIRREIDRTDDGIAELFARRMALAGEISAQKRAQGLPVEDVEREREIIKRVSSALPQDVEDYGRRLFETLLALSKEYQRELARRDMPAEES